MKMEWHTVERLIKLLIWVYSVYSGLPEPIHRIFTGHWISYFRALGKKGYLIKIEDNLSYISLKPYVVTTHLNCLDETVKMRGHNMFFYAELTKLSLIIIKYSLLSKALYCVCIGHFG